MLEDIKVSVLIGSKDRPSSLEKALQSIQSQDYPPHEILVLDDASETVDLKTQLSVKFPNVKFFSTPNSLGVAGGRNFLMKRASGDFLCILDDDAVFENNFALKQLVTTLKKSPCTAVVSVKIVDHGSEGNRLLVPFSKKALRKNPSLSERETKVSYYLGGCHMLRRSVLTECGYYQENLVFGGEEVDLAYRVVAAGYEIVYDPTVVVHHYPMPSLLGKTDKDSQKKVSGKQNNRGRGETYYRTRNRFYLAYKYLPWKYFPGYLVIWSMIHALQGIRRREIRDWVTGTVDGFLTMRNLNRSPIPPQGVTYLRQNYGRLWY